MSRPICVEHQREMSCQITGFAVLAVTDDGIDLHGWFGDLYVCSEGGERAVTGLGQAMYSFGELAMLRRRVEQGLGMVVRA